MPSGQVPSWMLRHVSSGTTLEKDDMRTVSEATTLSTFEQLPLNKGEVFERGVRNVFKGVSWNVKTNSPCKFGAKIIVTGLIDRLNDIIARHYSGALPTKQSVAVFLHLGVG